MKKWMACGGPVITAYETMNTRNSLISYIMVYKLPYNEFMAKTWGVGVLHPIPVYGISFGMCVVE